MGRQGLESDFLGSYAFHVVKNGVHLSSIWILGKRLTDLSGHGPCFFRVACPLGGKAQVEMQGQRGGIVGGGVPHELVGLFVLFLPS